MKMESITLATFSPTGTTEAVARSIAEGLDSADMKLIDLTRPYTRLQPLNTTSNELLIIAVPVYMGRVPALLGGWFNTLKANKTPTVCVVVYGNRVYDNALLELKDIVKQCGGTPIAAAAYIGEHSFSTPELPTAEGRPNQSDLEHAKSFGQTIQKKLDSLTSREDIPELNVPGVSPYGGVTELWDVDFIAVSENCTQCGFCAEICPMGAIDSNDSSAINQKQCITCCACMKRCPNQARTMKPGPVEDARHRLHNLFHAPKEPEQFIC